MAIFGPALLPAKKVNSKSNLPKQKMKSFLPLSPMPPSDDESKNSSVLTKNKVAAYASQILGASMSKISPVPTRRTVKAIYHGQLTPAPGRLTPTGQGRIKAPPVCTALSLKRVASTIDDFNAAGVCFLPQEAEGCAEKALVMDGKGGIVDNYMEDMPLKLDGSVAGESVSATSNLSLAPSTSSEGGDKIQQQFVSSSSTVVTTSTCGTNATGNENASMASGGLTRDPPLKVVRTDSAVNPDDEHAAGGGSNASEPASLSKSLSNTFTNNLIKDNLSRQGRSLQRWLVHSPTEELVRQVAGTIPITRDGRIILVSASRKSEWILPKGGWDDDETREECAVRETFEEAGLIGEIGCCLDPIDFETRKAQKRRLSSISGGANICLGDDAVSNSGVKVEGVLRGPLPKRAKNEATVPPSKIGYKLDLSGCLLSAASPLRSSVPTAPPTPVGPKKHSFVRLFLFPLYVSSAKADWPEKGRLRKIVDIDEAIQIMEVENRHYFRRGLEMVKERGLHLLMKQEGDQIAGQPEIRSD